VKLCNTIKILNYMRVGKTFLKSIIDRWNHSKVFSNGHPSNCLFTSILFEMSKNESTFSLSFSWIFIHVLKNAKT
jgi:hypothetical protein